LQGFVDGNGRLENDDMGLHWETSNVEILNTAASTLELILDNFALTEATAENASV
jgi:hypothetical protein